jgi:hypothetical protein
MSTGSAMEAVVLVFAIVALATYAVTPYVLPYILPYLDQ